MENLKVQIFHKFSGLRPFHTPHGVEMFFVCRSLPTNKNFFSLRPLCLCGESKQFYALLNNNVVIPDLIRNPLFSIWIPAFAGMTAFKSL